MTFTKGNGRDNIGIQAKSPNINWDNYTTQIS